jgi:hypothetical protein
VNSASPLAELLAYISAVKSGSKQVGPGNSAAAGQGGHTVDMASIDASIDYFRRTWSKVSTNRLLRESQAQVPDNAGPLNSNQLVHRALSAMRDVSPDYLHHMLLYVDALSWMEQLKDVGQNSGGTRNSAKGGGHKAGNGVRRYGAAGKEPVGKPR